MTPIALRLTNVPWYVTRRDLVRFFKNMDAGRCEVNIYYNKQKGISRGFARVSLYNQNLCNSILDKQSLEMENRRIFVTRWVGARDSSLKSE